MSFPRYSLSLLCLRKCRDENVLLMGKMSEFSEDQNFCRDAGIFGPERVRDCPISESDLRAQGSHDCEAAHEKRTKTPDNFLCHGDDR